MKKIVLCLLLLSTFTNAKLYAQSVFLKLGAPSLGRLEQAVNSSDEIVIAGTSTLNNQSILSTIHYNKCGHVLWSKQFSTDTNDLVLVDLKIDQNQNAILAGNYIYPNGDRNAFLLSLSPSGSINYFKVFDTGTADIVYSMDINSQNELLLYFKTNIGQAGPNSENTLAKLSADGQVIWIKEYGFTWVWGQMCSTSDGGALISDIRELVKVNDSGNVSWTRVFESNYYAQDHFEIPGGYVFFRYNSSALNRSYATMIDYSGQLKWNSQLIPNFHPSRGILRANGNILFVGDFQLQAIKNNPTFLELDSSNGNIINAVTQEDNNPLTNILDLSELSDQSIFYTGSINHSSSSGTIIGRLNDTLSLVNCLDSSIALNFAKDTSITLSNNSWTARTIDIPLISPSMNTSELALEEMTIFCEFSKAYDIDLGADTTLCPGESIRLSPPTNFEGYLWSTSENTASIQVNDAGTYWLKAWTDCDTLTDTIKVNYHSIAELELGNDTIVCTGDFITLSTNNGKIAYWSNGDTASSITVNQVGDYWAKIPTICGIISDTINLSHYPILKKPAFNDTTICYNASLKLRVDSKASYIRWSTNQLDPQIEVKNAGSYSVIIANACDTLYDTIQLSIHPKTQVLIQASTDTASVLDSIAFKVLLPKNFQAVLWDFDDGNKSQLHHPIHQYFTSGLLSPKVVLTDSLSCVYEQSLSIYIRALDYQIPNVFTPNGDGVNDYFNVSGKGIEYSRLKIFNRWGEIIYQSEQAAWDGRTVGGKAADDGTYFYLIQFKQKGNQEKSIRGSVQLIQSK